MWSGGFRNSMAEGTRLTYFQAKPVLRLLAGSHVSLGKSGPLDAQDLRAVAKLTRGTGPP